MPPDAGVFDWYATFAAPNAGDFWTRLTDIVRLTTLDDIGRLDL